MEYMRIQVHKMFCEVTVMLVQTQLPSVIVGESLVKFLLKKRQDLQITLHAFVCPVHPVRCSSSQCGRVC